MGPLLIVDSKGHRDLRLAPGKVNEAGTGERDPLEVGERRRIDDHDVLERGAHRRRSPERLPVGQGDPGSRGDDDRGGGLDRGSGEPA